MISVREALKIVAREAKPLGTERINLVDAVGRVLAEDILADSDLPPFDRSQMDGYAVKAADTKNTPACLKIVGESAAGRGWHNRLRKGEAVRIMTGAPVPDGADAVQKIELTEELGAFVTISEPTEKGRFIVKKGSETKKGRTVLRKGKRIAPVNIAIPAAFGYMKVKVAKRPRVAIFSTGTEVVEIGQRPKKDQIRNSNSLMLAAFCRAAGAEAQVFPTIGDDISELRSQISASVKKADVLITTGGVSVGKYDLTKVALQELGAGIFFDKVAVKPGKPTVFGKLRKTFVFGLPGNPVSAAVTFCLFVRKALLLMQGADSTDLPLGLATALNEIKGTKGRDSYLPGRLYIGTGTESPIGAEPIGWHGSSDFVGFSRADCLLFVPKESVIASGEMVEILELR
jgi:molybdenum cofactor synthesis domain-containing protein